MLEKIFDSIKMKSRIVKRVYPSGNIEYVIQQKHWLLRLIWVDACDNDFSTIGKTYRFTSLKYAQNALCFFDGTKRKDYPV